MSETAEEEASNLCQECKLKKWKYKCPGCSIRSCSLPCIKAHKTRTLCTGVRNRTESVPISKFDDNRLISDFNLLEEIKNAGESAKRLRNKLSIFSYVRLPFRLNGLRNAASGRRTRLQFLPAGMSRREQNRTRYDHRKKCIYWTIEWRFHSTNATILDHGIDENTNIAATIGKHLQPGPWHHKLKKFCDVDVDSLKFFIRKYAKGAKSPFQELDIKVPLRQQLTDMLILEYPVIFVFLNSHTIDFEVVKRASPIVHKPLHGVLESNNYSLPTGVPFKEEEIEDNNCSDPRVFDMMKHENPASSQNQFTHQERSEIVSSNLSESAFSSTVGFAAGSGLHSTTEAIEQALFSGTDFDFDQGLIDAYSDLIAEINPDDFLDLEGLLANQPCVDEFFVKEDDLEEGEIIE